MRIVWHWFTLGPYHFARMNAVGAQNGVELIVVENSSVDEHGWSRNGYRPGFELITLNAVDKRHCARELEAVLNRVRPDVTVSCGYAERHSWKAAKRHRQGRAASLWVTWSESSRQDRRRWPLMEMAKRFIVSDADGGLVAGSPQAEYLESLGMPSGRICQVGGCVDNSYFRAMAENRARTSEATNYFLYVGRFVAVKNLRFLLRAYACYRAEISRRGVTPWNLVLVGNGCEENQLRQIVAEEQIDGVTFAGPRQIDEIAAYYAGARALVLPSYSEPWGLVVNEAMASGLPVLVSDACGCAQDLVAPGVTGYVFHPERIDSCMSALVRMTLAPLDSQECKDEILRRVERFSPEQFAQKAIGHFERLGSESRREA